MKKTAAPRQAIALSYDGASAPNVTAKGDDELAEAILAIAREFVDGPELTDGVLNRIEAGIRCFDPCLSCSTHAIGAMPLQVQLVSAAGMVVDEVRR